MFARPVNPNNQGFLIRKDQSLNTTIKRYRSAVERLVTAYFDKRPVAIVVGNGRLGPAHVFAKFLDLTADDADVATISGPCPNAIDFMREIVCGIGFEPKHLSLSDLEGVLDLFLQHQRKAKRRTIIAVQEFDAHGWWVLDKIRRLIECEAEDSNGLMMLLSGPPSVNVVLNEPILDIISAHAGDRIELMPFSLSETRDFIRSHITSSVMFENTPIDIGELIDFSATNVVHECCDGIPDDVYRLCNKCLDIISSTNEKRITTAIVKQAIQSLGLAGLERETEPLDEATNTSTEAEPSGYLIVDDRGEESTQRIPVFDSSIVIGRDQHCDYCITGLGVSRFHSLFSLTPEGLVVVDLGSTNGTLVNGEKVDRSKLGPDDVVEIGHARITYVAKVARNLPQYRHSLNGNQDLRQDQHQEASINYAGDAFTFLNISSR